ncbi:hypothetical protein [Klugiella xanthotipulae]|nr:hypothetical protein [Klugiella xanthotipulae]
MSDDKNPTPDSPSPEDDGYVSDDRLAEALKRVRRDDLTPSSAAAQVDPRPRSESQTNYEPVSATGAIGLPSGLGLSADPTEKKNSPGPAAHPGPSDEGEHEARDEVSLDDLLAPTDVPAATADSGPMTSPGLAPAAHPASEATSGSPLIGTDPLAGLPSAAPSAEPLAAPAGAAEPIVVAEIPADALTIPADSPIAPLYVQAPSAPELRGNRGAGAWITLLATLGFALLYAGIVAALYAPVTTAASFLTRITDYLVTPAYIAPVAAFFIGLLLLVLIANRAGWWAYVLGGLIVGILVYGAATGGLLFSEGLIHMGPRAALDHPEVLFLSPFTILAGVAAREMSAWFGAWIAARGRKIKRANAEELADYEERLAASPLRQSVVIVD